MRTERVSPTRISLKPVAAQKKVLNSFGTGQKFLGLPFDGALRVCILTGRVSRFEEHTRDPSDEPKNLHLDAEKR